jgi:HEAT repeat protein
MHEDRAGRSRRNQHRRYLAALTLGEMGEIGEIGDPRAVDLLIEATRDPALADRAALSLGQIGDRRAIPALRQMARRLPSDRHWAGWGLARLGEPDGFDLLIDVAASDLGWDQRRHAILALGELGYRGAVEPLGALLEDDEVHLRVAAARALGEIGDSAALPSLRAALQDGERTTSNENVSVGEIAAAAVRRIEDRGRQPR